MLRCAGAAAVQTVLCGLWLGVGSGFGWLEAAGWVRQRAWQAAEWCV